MRKQSELVGSVSIRRVVTAVLSAAAFASLAAHAAEEAKKKEDVTTLSDMEVIEDPLRAIPTEPSATSFGFSKPLIETPRSVSFLSEEQLSLFGINTVQDLVRVVPGAFTTTRYGLQGGINVRSVTADQYFRGMKRLALQGHVRTVLSAMDSIEIVKGPPSPLYGMGKIGGYSNLIPKSARAKTGTYMTEDTGFIQGTTGSYNKAEVQFGVGGPMQVFGKQGGYYVFGLMENSNTYIQQVDAKQKFVQATTSVDNFIGPFRLETGGQLQQSITSGAYMNRATQNLVNDGTYITGSPLANLDLDSDGGVSYLETYTASAVSGSIGATNQALSQRVAPQMGADGRPAYAPINGIPQSMLSYLNLHPEINCSLANYMRTLPAAPALTGANGSAQQLPAGFALNPCTVGTTHVNYRRNGSFEREQNAKQNLIYLDLIYDTDPDFTVKNQLFYDRLDTFKDSNMPYGEKQDIRAFEEKVTVTKKITHLPQWLEINSLASANYRDTRGNIHSSGGDFDYRQDIMRGNGHLYSNNIFWNQLNDPTYATGANITTNRTSSFQEMGLGVLFDVTFFKNTNAVVGGRFDYAKARSRDFPDLLNTAGISPFSTSGSNVITPSQVALFGGGTTFTAGTVLDAELAAMRACSSAAALADSIANNAATPTVVPGTSANPVATGINGNPTTVTSQLPNVSGLTAAQRQAIRGCPGSFLSYGGLAKGYDHGPSFSISVSQQLPFGIRPYATYAKESLTLDGSNNIIQPTTVVQPEGFIGQAELKEVGIKSSMFHDRLFVSLAGYEQTRTDVNSPLDPGGSADVSATRYRGLEFEFKFVPVKELYLGGYVLGQKGKYIIDSTFNPELSGRELGFQDIVDPATGARYPAEAFIYGGRLATQISNAQAAKYRDRTGDPQIQAGFNATYHFHSGLGFLLSGNYFDAVWANRIKTIRLPSAKTFDAGITYDRNKWQLRLTGYNIFDERWWQSGAGDTNGQIITAKPGATWEFMIKKSF